MPPPWTGIIASSRAIDWSNAGLPAQMPLGSETTPNPWTPPPRATIHQTLSSTTDLGSAGSPVAATAINNALTACTPGQTVLIAANAYINTNIILVNNVTLRLSAGVTLFLIGNTRIITNQSTAANTAWTAGFTAGITTITVAAASNFAIGDLMALRQCNDGFSGINACAGSAADTGGVWNCANSPLCSEAGQGGNNPGQTQMVLITNRDTVANTVSFTPGLYMPNWNLARTPWAQNFHSGVGMGVEGGTIDGTQNTSGHANVGLLCYACWVKGVRMVNGGNPHIATQNAKNYLIANNYFTSQPPNAPENINPSSDSDGLIINNIGEIGPLTEVQSASESDAYLYNFTHFGWSNSNDQSFTGNIFTYHESGEAFTFLEGNQGANAQWDNDHATHNLNTAFRNLFSANDPPYTKSKTIWALEAAGAARFMNWIGNVLGSQVTTSYQCIFSDATCGSPVYIIGQASNAVADQLAFTSSFRWGNYDNFTGAAQFNSAEVPTTLTGAAAPFSNPVPASHTLPPSFLSTMPSTPFPNGGTGLNWWKVCINYPTCTSFQVQPYPPIGPDVTGGSVIGGFNYNGHAYDIPAAVAWKNLPVDPFYQNTYTISNATWTAGTVQLTITGLPIVGGNPMGLVGELTVTGVTPSGYNGTFQITNSDTASHVSYALASNPGLFVSAGSILWPNIRQFNASLIYQTDSSAGGSVVAPTFNPPGGTYVNNAQNVTISTVTSGATICYTVDGTIPSANGAGTCVNGITYSGPVSISTNTLLRAMGSKSGLSDSTVSAATYVIIPSFSLSGSTSMVLGINQGWKITRY